MRAVGEHALGRRRLDHQARAARAGEALAAEAAVERDLDLVHEAQLVLAAPAPRVERAAHETQGAQHAGLETQLARDELRQLAGIGVHGQLEATHAPALRQEAGVHSGTLTVARTHAEGHVD